MATKLMRCTLCGHEFDPAALACHSACPLSAGCAVICCPNCGYHMVNESRSKTVVWLRRVWDGVHRRPAAGREETL
jgi:rubredoxin